MPSSAQAKFGKVGIGAHLTIVALAIGIGLYRVGDSGPLWPDGPRYANAAAMIHDWLRAGDLSQPYEFACKNYTQYPGFNIPYHPPAYPGILALVFLVTGVSYVAARVFVAVCFGVAGALFLTVLRRLGTTRTVAWACALLMVTTPEIARWSRDTMSEIPALAALLAGSYCFVAWLQKGRAPACWLAFVLAEVAFLARVTSIGIMPAWVLFAFWNGDKRRLRSLHFLSATLLYLLGNIAWVLFAASYSRIEVAADGRDEVFSWRNLEYFTECVPVFLVWGTTAVGLLGAVAAVALRRRCPAGIFWLSWLIGYSAFKLAVATTHEPRHFLTALPAFAGLAACLCSTDLPRVLRSYLAPALVVLALMVNAVHLSQLPLGMVGYEPLAERMARLDKPGNFLLACWEDQDLIFRYRAWAPESERRMHRSDRVEVRVRSGHDLQNIIRRGRVRYLVTFHTADHSWGVERQDFREDLQFAHDLTSSNPADFVLLERYSWTVAWTWRDQKPVAGEIFLWEFTGELPPGPSEILVEIPTAGIILRPD